MNQIVSLSSLDIADDPSVRIPPVSVAMFCTSAQMAGCAAAAFADRRMARATAVVHDGDFDAAIAKYGDIASPDLLIVETALDRDAIFNSLEQLAEVCAETTRLIVLGSHNDVAFYRALVAQGVSEYAVSPVAPLELISLVASVFADPAAAKTGRSVVFIGATGGCGSSTLAQNVAAAMGDGDSTQRIVLADFDIPFGSAGLAFNLDNSQGAAQALQSADRLDEVLLERLLVKSSGSLNLLPAPAALEQELDLGQGARKVYETALSVANVVVCDLPHVWSRWSRELIFAADEIVITSPPTLLGLRNTKNLLHRIRTMRPNDRHPKLILNQVGIGKRREVKQAVFEDTVQAKAVACIRFDPATFSEAETEGQVVVQRSPRSPAAKAIGSIAESLGGVEKHAPRGWSLFRKLGLLKNRGR